MPPSQFFFISFPPFLVIKSQFLIRPKMLGCNGF
jgi:hypothetical protein